MLDKFKGYLFLTCGFILAGTSVISARLLSGSLGIFTTTAVSLFFAVLVLLPLCLRKISSTVHAMSPRDWIYTALQALFGIFLFRLLLLQGLLRTSTAEASVLTGASPAITAILAWLCLKEPVRAKNIAGIISTVAGIALIQGLLTHSFTPAHLLGNLLVLGAAACESTFNILSRRSVVKKSVQRSFDPIVQTTLVVTFALLFCLLPALFEQPARALSALSLTGWLALIWYGWLGTALAFIFWYAGIKRCPAQIAAAFSGLMPLTSMVLAAAALGEPAGWHQWAGAALVILGIVLIGIQARPRIRSISTAPRPLSAAKPRS